ncbi:cytochrome-c peroxidase [Salinisphaera sp. PC39]|uniref:cytochrome-c peroxidase n=1 Tax=Salinisphaera sp. PC39 TaxID=1304156 RepID=UPI00333F96BA
MKGLRVLILVSVPLTVAVLLALARYLDAAGDNATPVPVERYRGPVSQWPEPHVDAGVDWRELGPLPEPPGGREWTPKTRLGRLLFFDPMLSGSGQIACASCHDPDLAWGDGRKVPFGHNRMLGRRNTPSLINVAYLDTLMWDGRASTLEGQMALPVGHPDEMHADIPELVARVAAQAIYPDRFQAAFGDPEITYARITAAIADFERHLTSRRSRFDDFISGDHDALRDEEIRGLHWFRTQGRCMNCHHGPLFTDQSFHNLGLNFYGRPLQDLGRYDVTGDPADAGRFRTAPLRGVAHTGPYMHNGLIPALENVILFYNKGGAHPRPDAIQADDPLFPETSRLLQPLDLTPDQVREIVAFLEAISVRPNRLSMRFARTLRERAAAHPADSSP